MNLIEYNRKHPIGCFLLEIFRDLVRRMMKNRQN